jgi:hypothetical protein
MFCAWFSRLLASHCSIAYTAFFKSSVRLQRNPSIQQQSFTALRPSAALPVEGRYVFTLPLFADWWVLITCAGRHEAWRSHVYHAGTLVLQAGSSISLGSTPGGQQQGVALQSLRIV